MNHPKEIDWEQRKWELVCHIAQGLIAGNRSSSALETIQLADEIITAYKDSNLQSIESVKFKPLDGEFSKTIDDKFWDLVWDSVSDEKPKKGGEE